MGASVDTVGDRPEMLRTPAGSALPLPVSGQSRALQTAAGALTYYSAGPDGMPDSGAPPLLLIHSVNAAASAYEIKPLYEHYRQSRIVYALDLPGFGHSDRSDRVYTIRMMTDAIRAMVEEIRRIHHGVPIDALAVSLSCEFLARAAFEMPNAFRSLALVSPTGFDGKAQERAEKARADEARKESAQPSGEATRAMPWLHGLLTVPLWSRGFFRTLTSRAGIRFFLKKTWGSAAIDEGLLDYDYLTTHQPGARHAPYYFVSGYLFSLDIMRIYRALTGPIWMAHGVRGDFVDYEGKHLIADRPNWSIDVFQTGALPHFEVTDAFSRAYDGFIKRCV